MMHLRGLVLILLLRPGDARRSIRVDGSHHDAQQQNDRLASGLEVSAEAREGLIPGGFGRGVLRRVGSQASALREGPKQDGRRVGYLGPHRAVPWFRPGPRHAKVGLQQRMAAVATLCTGPAAAPLFSLGDNLVRATFVRRPSGRNRSPYVCDVRLADGREAIAHCPSMDMGGKLFEGVEVLLRPATDKAGKPVGSDQMGKYGTPKCEFIMLMLRCCEPENSDTAGCWVGAHPSIGERVADALLKSGALTEEIGGGRIEKVQREVTGVAGTDMRCDFLLTHADESRTIVEVKTVVDTDYDPAHTLPERFADKKCVFLGRATPYERSAIFPWGKPNQKGPDGEKVVSARAIKQVRELTKVASGELAEADGTRLAAVVLFVVVRTDARRFRPNTDACPSFARYLNKARDAGVRVLAHRIRWGADGAEEGGELGAAYHEGAIPIDFV